jgi:hypothetical protein
VGLLIASGNVGNHLGNVLDSNIFLSRDGGRHWSEILNGTYKWAVVDYGNVIIFAEEKFTNKLIYTVDFGKSFSEFQFSGNLFKIDLLDSASDSDSLSIFVKGSDFDNPSAQKLIHVDFTNILKEKCTRDTDVELWALSEGDDDCVLGAKRTYIRRKPESLCFFGKNYDPWASSETKSCPCSYSDYEW